MSAAAAAAAASAAPLAPSTSTSAADEDDNTGGGSDDNTSVLFFAYGALMDPTVMRSRLQGRKAGSSPPRAAVAVAFAEKGGRKEGKSSSSSVAVAFVHRGGWATLVDLRRARASAASPLWRLVPGSRGEEEDRSRGGGWGQAEGGRSDDERARDGGPSFSASSGPCFCSPAHGVLYALSSESDLEALSEREGGYSLRKVEVRVSGSGGGGSGGVGAVAPGDSKRALLLLEASAFVSSPGLRLRSPLPPRERYLEKMRSGARAAGLDEGYRAWLERVPSAEDLDGRYQATPAGAVAAAAGVAVFAAVMCLLV